MTYPPASQHLSSSKPGPHVALSVLSSTKDAGVIAGWIWNEWAQFEPGVMREESDSVIWTAREVSGRGELPYCVVAHVDGELAGCAFIVEGDLPMRPALGPWLANVYVLPKWRGKGIASQLTKAASAHGLSRASTLYLYTPDQAALYERLGWEKWEKANYAGKRVEVMRFPAQGQSD